MTSTPAETSEWRWVPVYQQTNPQDEDSKTLFTGSVTYSVFPDGGTPATYVPAVPRNGLSGIVVSGLTRGTYRVKAKPASPPDAPVIDCGTFTLK